jgi:hypothetical protein
VGLIGLRMGTEKRERKKINNKKNIENKYLKKMKSRIENIVGVFLRK